MRKTLAGICALSLTALGIAQCANSENGGIMTGPGGDMAAAEPDLSEGDSGPPDLTGAPGRAEFVVVRIGAGANPLNNDATAAFLERRSIANGALVGSPLALPTAASGANKQLTMSGQATVEGQLSRSADGRYLLIAGYAANPGVKDIATTSSSTYNRVIGRIDAASNVDTTTATASFSGASVRGATSTDGNMLWISTDAGIGYLTLGSTMPTVLSTAVTRSIDIFSAGNGPQLYVSSASSSGSYMGLNAVGSGTPTAAGTSLMRLPGFTDSNSPSSVGFVAFDRDNNGAIDQLYVADDRTTGGVQRWKLNGATWMLEGTISTGSGSGARFVAGYATPYSAQVLVTTAEAFGVQSRILLLTDAGGATSTVSAKVLATAAANTTYRGIAIAPNQ